MHLACYSFGIGALLVNTLAKCIPDSRMDKFAFNFNENNEPSFANVAMKM